MNKFVWTNEYSLGISIIDEQHHHFFDIANMIYDLLGDKKAESHAIVEIVAELKNYAFYHLATEEKYFNQFAYSDIGNHMKYHAEFRKKSEEYSDRVEDTKEDLPKLALELTDFSKNWLQNHILVADRLYAPFFKRHGLK